jgi:hypothetical protein
MSIITPRLFEQLNSKAKPLLDTKPTNPTYYLQDSTRNIFYYTKDYSKAGNLMPSSVGGGIQIPQQPLTTALQPYTQKTLESKRVRVFDFINPPHDVKPIVQTSWVPNTILEASMIVHPDGLPRNPTPQGAIINPADIQNRILMAEASGNPQLAEQIKQRYDPNAVAQDKLKERIQKLRDEGDDKQADDLEERYFSDHHRHKKQLDAIGSVSRNISKIKIPMGIGEPRPMEKAIEEKFNEILANRPTDIADEMKRVEKEIKDRIDALRARGNLIPPELQSFKDRFAKFDEGKFISNFGSKPKVNPRKLSETNKEALENLARFLISRSPTASEAGSEAGSRRGSLSSIGGDPFPLNVSKAATQKDIDEFERLRVLMMSRTKDWNDWSNDDFKEVRLVAGKILDKTESDKLDNDLDSGKINQRQYAVLVAYKAKQLQEYFDKKGKGGGGGGKGIPAPMWDVNDPVVLIDHFDDDVGRGFDINDVVDNYLETIKSYYKTNKGDLDRDKDLMTNYKKNLVILALKSLGKAIDTKEVDKFLNNKGKKLKKPEVIFSKATAHFG